MSHNETDPDFCQFEADLGIRKAVQIPQKTGGKRKKNQAGMQPFVKCVDELETKDTQ